MTRTPWGATGFVCDFDGTITMEDVAVALLQAYAPHTWQPPVQAFVAGGITVEELLQQQFACVRASERELTDYAVAHAVIRPGFPEFVAGCQRRGFPLTIASAGLAFYLHAILQRAGIAVPEIDCGRAEFTPNGIRVTYGHLTHEDGERTLDLKERAVERLRRAGYRVVYIGDGLADLSAARRADLVFACGRLAEACDEHSIAYQPFTDFYAIIAALAERPA